MRSDPPDNSKQRFTIVIAALGGQGGGVLSGWIVDLAEQNGFLAQATSVPGVAQRTGATIYYLELFSAEAARAAGRDPVLALMPQPGQVDILIAAELMEAGRAVLRGLATAGCTTVVASTHRDYSISEKCVAGDGIADGDLVLRTVEQAARRLVSFDMAELAERTGSVINAVLLGALAATGRLPFPRAGFEDAIRRGAIAVEQNLAGFRAGFQAGSETAEVPDRRPGQVAASGFESAPDELHTRVGALRRRVADSFPEAAGPVIRDGIRRLVDHQDFRYAHAYLERLEPIYRLDRAGSDRSYRLTREVARHLALWMAYEDAFRVAQLKVRSDRLRRVRQELRAEPDQLVRIVEFLHPRVEELCDALPAPLGRWILRRPAARKLFGKLCAKGRHVATTRLSGFLMLSCVAGLRRWRRFSYRYGRELTAIDGWIEKIRGAAVRDPELAIELARCRRVIKGYGETHQRGLANFNAILGALERIRGSQDAAGTARDLQDAALADEDGTALEAALAELC